jgi:hypothetical protein
MTESRYIAAILFIALVSGCATPIDPAQVKLHQLQVQRMQTRVVDTNNRRSVARGVIATLQDLGFVIDNVDIEQGVIAAKKFGSYPIEMTVTIQSISDKQVLVHGIAQYNLKTIEDPVLYERFFSSLQESLPLAPRPGD